MRQEQVDSHISHSKFFLKKHWRFLLPFPLVSLERHGTGPLAQTQTKPKPNQGNIHLTRKDTMMTSTTARTTPAKKACTERKPNWMPQKHWVASLIVTGALFARWSAKTALLVALPLALCAVAIMPHATVAQTVGYVFTPIAFIPGSAPGGGSFINDFEPYAINDPGEIAFVADVDTGGEGIFTKRPGGPLTEIVRSGQAAPEGGTFDFTDLGHVALNNNGDGAFAFLLSPFTLPFGNNSGVYGFSRRTGRVTAVVVPGVTPVPGGGTFSGSFFNVSLNNPGDVAFTGMVPASVGPGASIGLGLGIFQADKFGHISTLARPGDPAPGGNTFDYVTHPWINDSGAVAFGAHVTSDPCIAYGQTLPVFIFCAESIYKKSATGVIQSIAHQGQPAPGGGTYQSAFGPAMNNAGAVVFVGDLTPAPNVGESLAVFLNTGATTISVARPGDAMPGGGHIVTAGILANGSYSLNNRGDVAFSARLDTDVNSDGAQDTGLYLRSGGSLRLVARTGTVIPGVGTVAHINPPALSTSTGAQLSGGGAINDRGQIFFQVTLTDGTGVLLTATP